MSAQRPEEAYFWAGGWKEAADPLYPSLYSPKRNSPETRVLCSSTFTSSHPPPSSGGERPFIETEGDGIFGKGLGSAPSALRGGQGKGPEALRTRETQSLRPLTQAETSRTPVTCVQGQAQVAAQSRVRWHSVRHRAVSPPAGQSRPAPEFE